MIRHVILFRFKPDAPSEGVDAARRQLATLPSLLPQIKEFSQGADVGHFDHNYDYVIIAGFNNLDEYVAYRDDPVHLAIIDTYMKPILDEYVRVQYDTASPVAGRDEY